MNSFSKTASSNSEHSISQSESYYLTVSGIDPTSLEVLPIIDSTTFSATSNSTAFSETNLVGDKAVQIITATDKEYEIIFESLGEPLAIESLKGINNSLPSEAVRYSDVVIPTGVKIKAGITLQGLENLRYDADGDGVYETEISPNLSVSGSAAEDLTAPDVTISYQQQGTNQLVTLSATDIETGVKEILYSLNGVDYQVYSQPFMVTPSQTSQIYAFADDNNLNRSNLLQFSIPPIAMTNQPVRPVLECVVANNDGTYTARFGYKNENTVPVTIAVGTNNKFSPNPIDRGQVTDFQPGRVYAAFNVNFNGSNLVWTLKGPDNKGRTSTASQNSARCQ